MNCNSCGAKNKSGANFCLACGAPLFENKTIVCSVCKKSTHSGHKFCKHCGKKFVATVTKSIANTVKPTTHPNDYSTLAKLAGVFSGLGAILWLEKAEFLAFLLLVAATVIAFPYLFWRIIAPRIRLSPLDRAILWLVLFLLAFSATPSLRFGDAATPKSIMATPSPVTKVIMPVRKATPSPIAAALQIKACTALADLTERNKCISRFIQANSHCGSDGRDPVTYAGFLECIGWTDPDCNYFQNNSDCFIARAILTKDISECPNNIRYNCAVYTAINYSNRSYCDLTGSEYLGCYIEFAEATNNTTSCFEVFPEDSKNNCLDRVAKHSLNLSVCVLINNTRFNPDCANQVYDSTKPKPETSINLCWNLEVTRSRFASDCYRQLAYATKNDVYCYKLGDLKVVDECKLIVQHMINVSS